MDSKQDKELVKQQECPVNKIHKLDKEETGEMSQKRDREEEEDMVKDHKVPKLRTLWNDTIDTPRVSEWSQGCSEKNQVLSMDKKCTSVPWDMNDMDAIMKELDSRPTPPSFEQLRQRYERLQADLLQKEEK